MSARAAAANPSLGEEMLRTAWLFQAGTALPIVLLLGFLAFAELFVPYISIYYFVTDMVNALLAAGIIFIVLIQRKISAPTKYITLLFEGGKSVLASVMWLWHFLDSLYGPWPNDPYYRGDWHRRVLRAAFSFILLLTLFYPTLGYAIYAWRKSRTSVGDVEQDQEANIEENTPLLAEVN